jgi:hypothetical protein
MQEFFQGLQTPFSSTTQSLLHILFHRSFYLFLFCAKPLTQLLKVKGCVPSAQQNARMTRTGTFAMLFKVECIGGYAGCYS